MDRLNPTMLGEIAATVPGEHSTLLNVRNLAEEEGFSTHKAFSPHPAGIPISSYRNQAGELVIAQRDGLSHAIVSGNSGAGKSLRFLTTALFDLTGEYSVLITDVKGELYRLTSNYLKTVYGEENVKLIDFMQPQRSQVFFNPLYPLAVRYRDAALSEHKEALQSEVLNEAMNLFQSYFQVSSQRDPTWEQVAISFIFGIFVEMLERLNLTRKQEAASGCKRVLPEQVSFANLANIFQSFTYDSYRFSDNGFFSRSPSTRSAQYVRGVIHNAPSTRANYLQFVEKFLNEYTFPDAKRLMFTDNLDPRSLGEKPQVLFLSYDLSDKNMRNILNKYILRALNVLKDESKKRGDLLIPVMCFFDEFASLTSDELYPTIFSIGRGLGIFITAIVQDYSQLETAYSAAVAKQIRNNCNLSLYFGSNDLSTAVAVKEQIGKYMDFDRAAYLMNNIRFQENFLVSEDELMHRMKDGDIYITANRKMPMKGSFELYYQTPEFTAYPLAEPIQKAELDYNDAKYVYDISQNDDEIEDEIEDEDEDEEKIEVVDDEIEAEEEDEEDEEGLFEEMSDEEREAARREAVNESLRGSVLSSIRQSLDVTVTDDICSVSVDGLTLCGKEIRFYISPEGGRAFLSDGGWTLSRLKEGGALSERVKKQVARIAKMSGAFLFEEGLCTEISAENGFLAPFFRLYAAMEQVLLRLDKKHFSGEN